MSWHFTEEKILQQISGVAAGVVRDERKIEALTAIRQDGSHTPISPGETYWAVSETVVLEAEVTVPKEWHGQRVYVALELSGAETLVYIDGVAVQAIDRYHHDLLLSEQASGERTHRLRLESYTGSVDSNNNTGWIGGLETDADAITVLLKTAALQWIDREAEALFFDLTTAVHALKKFDPNSREHTILKDALDQAVNRLDFRYPKPDQRFYDSVAAARDYYQSRFAKKYHADPDFTPVLRSVGHAHIDTAWLWPLAHTRKKIGRTFTSQLTLAERYRDLGYVFTCSQPQQYAYLKEDYPEVYERIKGAIKRGQWETVGGMWVESDCNVISGESLVRQFLYGLRFLKREFGTHTDVVWLPDVFGYAASMPQIIKKVGMKYFMTIKIYWNQINKPPYQTFEWEGIDGTRVLTHFAPGGDYNANMTPEQVVDFWNAYNQKNLSDTSLYIYGYGDGGGGPTRQMLETARRLEDFPNMPRIKPSSAQAFFEELERQVEGNSMLPRWVGELYLEYHRGTYTSQANNKKWNRQSEFALQAAEQLGSLAAVIAGAAYRGEQITKLWELTLLNQFHDIIPGSSVNAVYRDSDQDYATILSGATEIKQAALSAITETISAEAGDVVLYNPLSWARRDMAAVPRSLGLSGQETVDLEGVAQTLISLADTPSLGYAVVKAANNAPAGVSPQLTASKNAMENRFFKLTFDANFEISSLIDKRTGREVIDSKAICKGNALLTFEDKPMNYDAWDIDIYYQDKVYPVQSVVEAKVVEQGPLRATIEIKRQFGRGSAITQRVSLWSDLARIDFDTLVDWRERQTLLKAAFPVTVHSPRATFDIQFGNAERPTHWNTSWDWARFEVCGQKWADLSEGGEDGYGVALLSDSKYGWDIKGNIMRLTLLKGAVKPDAEADLGVHRFVYSLMPHAGDWRGAGVVQRAYELNVPVQAARAALSAQGTSPPSLSFASIDQPNLIIETVKKAEDDDSVIVRLYEAYGQRGQATLHLFRDVKSAVEVNLMEEETEETKTSRLAVSGRNIAFDFTPYEIKTFKIRL